MTKENILKRLEVELEEKTVKESSYIYVKRANGSIVDWYYTDSVDELKDFQKEMFESEEFSKVPFETKRGFNKYIEQLSIDKPYLEKMKVSDVLEEISK